MHRANVHPADLFDSDPDLSIAVEKTPALPPHDGNDALAGERFGKYLIVGELAVGGMAEVFLGVQRGVQGFTKVAVIKRVLPAYSADPGFVQMFIDEARLAARLEHSNIVRTYEFGEVDSQYFTAMEYLPGEDLRRLLGRLTSMNQMLPVYAAAAIMTRVCQGLHFAHEMTDTSGRPLGLVHRDVNPANILLTYTGEVKLIDFGVAKTSESHTQNGTIKGKLAYMSPEQLLARGIDRRSDVFSAGVVLWELLTRRHLFTRESEASTIYSIMNDPLSPPSRYRPGIPRELEAIVMRALARTPVDRFDTAEDMGAALDAFLASQPRCDARALGSLLEQTFGIERAEAKRAIAQSCALTHNVSLVMKLRSGAPGEPASDVGMLARGSDLGEQPALPAQHTLPRGHTTLMYVIAALMLAILGAAALYLARSDAEPAASKAASGGGAIRIESTPAGAAITVGGEPTGLHTPATLTGLSARDVSIGVTLPGYARQTDTLAVPTAGTTTKHFTLRTP